VQVQSRYVSMPEAAIVDVDLRGQPDAMPCGLNLSELCRTQRWSGCSISIDQRCPRMRGFIPFAFQRDLA